MTRRRLLLAAALLLSSGCASTRAGQDAVTDATVSRRVDGPHLTGPYAQVLVEPYGTASLTHRLFVLMRPEMRLAPVDSVPPRVFPWLAGVADTVDIYAVPSTTANGIVSADLEQTWSREGFVPAPVVASTIAGLQAQADFHVRVPLVGAADATVALPPVLRLDSLVIRRRSLSSPLGYAPLPVRREACDVAGLEEQLNTWAAVRRRIRLTEPDSAAVRGMVRHLKALLFAYTDEDGALPIELTARVWSARLSWGTTAGEAAGSPLLGEVEHLRGCLYAELRSRGRTDADQMVDHFDRIAEVEPWTEGSGDVFSQLKRLYERLRRIDEADEDHALLRYVTRFQADRERWVAEYGELADSVAREARERLRQYAGGVEDAGHSGDAIIDALARATRDLRCRGCAEPVDRAVASYCSLRAGKRVLPADAAAKLDSVVIREPLRVSVARPPSLRFHACDARLAWDVEDPSIAHVDRLDHVLTGERSGATYLSLRPMGAGVGVPPWVVDSVFVVPRLDSVQIVRVDHAAPHVGASTLFQLRGWVDGREDGSLDPSAYQWHVDSPSQAHIDAGLLVGLRAGKTEVRATHTTTPRLRGRLSVDIQEHKLRVLEVGGPGESEDRRFTVLFEDHTGEPVRDSRITWELANVSLGYLLKVEGDSTTFQPSGSTGRTYLIATARDTVRNLVLRDSVVVERRVPPVSAIRLESADSVLLRGAQLVVRARVLGEGNTLRRDIDASRLLWDLMDADMLAVAGDAAVIQIRDDAEFVRIFAEYTSGGSGSTVEAELALQILDLHVSDVAISSDGDLDALVPGGSAQLVVSPIVGEDVLSFEWSSSDPAVAIISSDGVLVAGSPGTAIVTAVGGGAQLETAVTVVAASASDAAPAR